MDLRIQPTMPHRRPARHAPLFPPIPPCFEGKVKIQQHIRPLPRARSRSSSKDSSATIGFEAKLWLAADKLRNNMDAAEPEHSGDSQPQAARRASGARQYKHIVLGLIFLKYISDTFEEHRARLTGELKTSATL